MAPNRKKYDPLVEDEQNNYIATASSQAPPSHPTNRTLIVFLLISSLGNFLWLLISGGLLYLHFGLAKNCGPEKSLYAGLTNDVPIPFRDITMFVHYNSVVADATWDSWVIEPGIVALPHDFVNQKMLPQAKESPLDSEKGVYVLSSYHSLHCLKKLRDSYINAMSGRVQADDGGIAFDHNMHCFDFLRQDIICHADDTPRYTGFSKGEAPGMMQSRMCRSWDKMEAWARDHTACYRDMSQDVTGFPHLNYTTHCPNGYIYSADGNATPPWVKYS